MIVYSAARDRFDAGSRAASETPARLFGVRRASTSTYLGMGCSSRPGRRRLRQTYAPAARLLPRSKASADRVETTVTLAAVERGEHDRLAGNTRSLATGWVKNLVSSGIRAYSDGSWGGR
jgi:hypothetical protein